MSLIERPSRWCVACFVAFIIVSGFVVLGVTLPWDTSILLAIGPSRVPPLINIMLAGQVLGDGQVEIPFALALGLLFWRLGFWDRTRRYLLAGLSGEALYVALKLLFHRPRPEVIPHLGEAGWYSYPSGHAMLAPVIWGFGLLLLARSITHRHVKRVLLVLAVFLPIWVSCCRVYLGVHYPSDVLGAAFLGIGWVLLWREPGASLSSDSTSFAPATR